MRKRSNAHFLSGDSAEKAKTQFGDRFIPSRYVVTRPNPGEFKARWCLRGYLDPDVMELVGGGSTQSPTVSQLGLMLSCQMIVSSGWNSQLGDIRGAFLGSRLSGQETRTVVLEPPSRRNSRGAGWCSDSHPWKHLWFERCASTLVENLMTSIGFTRSTFDVCVYSLRSTAVNDTICGGSGPLFSKALSNLRHRFPFRKWQVGEGMFCGSKYVQNKDNKEIMITQTEFAVKITKVPMFLARNKMRDGPADKAEIHAFRGVSGSISWLAGQTRPGVSCQVSQLQQALPQPTVAQVCGSNMVVRRVHQHADLGLKIRRIPVQNMMLVLHVDASLNTGGLVGSQGGFICGVTDKSLLERCDAPWSPMAWRSFKMSRTVPSSLGAEASHVCGFGLCRVGNSFSAIVDSWSI